MLSCGLAGERPNNPPQPLFARNFMCAVKLFADILRIICEFRHRCLNIIKSSLILEAAVGLRLLERPDLAGRK